MPVSGAGEMNILKQSCRGSNVLDKVNLKHCPSGAAAQLPFTWEVFSRRE